MLRSRRLVTLPLVLVSLASCRAIFVDSQTNVVTSPWHLAEPVTPTTTTLDLLVQVDRCGGPSTNISADVSYGPDEITIGTKVVLGNCLTGPGLVPFTVELREPVGSRALVDPNACRAQPELWTPTPDLNECPGWGTPFTGPASTPTPPN